MPHNAFWGRSAGQVNVTRIWFAEYVNDGKAAGYIMSMREIQAWNPSQSGRSEPSAELAQPALSSRRAYIPAALTPDRPSTQLVVTQYLFIHDNNFGMKSSVFGDGTVHDMGLKYDKMFICIVGLPAG